MKNDGGQPDIAGADIWELWLYVAGDAPSSRRAIANLEAICEGHLKGRCRLQVIDLLEQPELAAQHQILALPTLVRKSPEPVRKIIGDLAATQEVLSGLGLRSRDER